MEEVRHQGIIIDITPDITKVEIVRSSACSACHAKELCGFSESEKKIVDVATSGFDPHQIGDEVTVCMKRSMGMKAVWIAYVIPLVILMVSVLSMSALGCPELVMGLGAIAAVALYYVVILCLRSKLSNEFIFYIK
ncbi:MAG: SoxR reducing system RseC family protein [Bacteroidales bacterium]|nr:SoxR reducing system RseC family protein [Bacteroidales bacterium]